MENAHSDPNVAPQTDPAAPEKPVRLCPNCQKKLSGKAIFCPKCGQRQTDGKVRMRDLLWKLWVTTFHLDTKFLRSVWFVLQPGKLTKEYFAGRQKRYFHPIQFFLVSLFILMLLISKTSKGFRDIHIFQFFQGSPEAVKGKLDYIKQLDSAWDSLPVHLQKPLVKEALDSMGLYRELASNKQDTTSMNFNFLWIQGDYKLAIHDILYMDPDSLVEHYKVKGWMNRLVFRQTMRASVDNKGFSNFWVGTISWSLLVLVAVMAVWLKLLYVRRNRFFVEHFIFLLHLQTGLFVVTLVALAARKWLGVPAWVGFAILLWLTLGYYIGFKKFYQQGYIKTFFKLLLYDVLFLISAVFVVLGSLAVTVLLF
jgi:hypothetical protein